MYPPSIAAQLRLRSHDVDAVAERVDLRGLSDPAVFATAQAEGRAVVTENLADFIRVVNEHDRRGEAHHGVVLVDPATHPRGASPTIGRMVSALDLLLSQRPGHEAVSLRHWL
jgi:hypothetical protein